jgi:hypothetical protein
LNADPEDYFGKQRKKLKDVQAKTRSTKRRYHRHYQTAKEVKENFEADLSSDAADKVQDDLRGLGLPTLDSLKDEFDQLASQLGVGS